MKPTLTSRSPRVARGRSCPPLVCRRTAAGRCRGGALVDVTVKQSAERIVGGDDGMEIAGEMQIDLIHWQYLGTSASGSPFLSYRGLGQARARAVPLWLGGRCCPARSAGRRRDRCDQNDLAPTLHGLGQPKYLRNPCDGLELRRLGDLRVGACFGFCAVGRFCAIRETGGKRRHGRYSDDAPTVAAAVLVPGSARESVGRPGRGLLPTYRFRKLSEVSGDRPPQYARPCGSSCIRRRGGHQPGPSVLVQQAPGHRACRWPQPTSVG